MLLYKLVMFVLCFPDEFFPSHKILYNKKFIIINSSIFFLST
jgi:hypothetical protein